MIRGVLLFSAAGRAACEPGPRFREDPAGGRLEPPWCDECCGHRSECAFCGHRGDGCCDGVPYPADLEALDYQDAAVPHLPLPAPGEDQNREPGEDR